MSLKSETCAKILTAAIAAWCAAGLVRPSTAEAAGRKKKVAVLLVKTGKVPLDLADSLTEWIIARLAAKGTYDMVGKEAFRARIGQDEKAVFACVSNKTCISNVATALSLDVVLVGALGLKDLKGGKVAYSFHLYLIDAVSAQEIKRVYRQVKGPDSNLGPALDTAITEVLTPPVIPGGLLVKVRPLGAKVHLDDRFVGAAPVALDKVQPGKHVIRVVEEGHYTAQRTVVVEQGRIKMVDIALVRKPRSRRSWLFYTAYSSLALAVAAGVSAAVLGPLSVKDPKGSTQVEVWADLERRRKMALSANILMGIGGAAALTCMATFIFGRRRFTIHPAEKAGSGPRVGLIVLPSGGAASASWSF